MKSTRQTTFFRIACVTLVVASGMLMPACGGGGSSGGGGSNPLVATFTPSNPTPGANTISMGGSASGQSFTVVVQVTDINDFYGAGFRVTFDSSTAQYVSFSNMGSVLLTAGVVTDFKVDLLSPGNLTVSATIQDASQPAGIDVAGTQTLITLNFRATAATGANAFAFADPRDVEACPTQGGACSNISGALSWPGGTMSASR